VHFISLAVEIQLKKMNDPPQSSSIECTVYEKKKTETELLQ